MSQDASSDDGTTRDAALPDGSDDASHNDGALEDGAIEDGAIEDGAIEDAIVADRSIPDADVTSAKRIFITSFTFTGAMQSLADADDACQFAADQAGTSGTFAAFLSDNATDAIDRVPVGGPWVSMKGTLIFADRSEWMEFPRSSAYGFDEGGITNSVDYWTGSLLGGESSSSNCDNWKNDQNLRGQFGSPATDDWWIERSTGLCSESRSLLCFEL